MIRPSLGIRSGSVTDSQAGIRSSTSRDSPRDSTDDTIGGSGIGYSFDSTRYATMHDASSRDLSTISELFNKL